MDNVLNEQSVPILLPQFVGKFAETIIYYKISVFI